jgi:hypothetical protein
MHDKATAAGRRAALNAGSADAAPILEAISVALIDNGISGDTAVNYCLFWERGFREERAA